MSSEKKNNGRSRYLQAAALQYDQERHEAPVVVAKGSRVVAEKIIEMAKSIIFPCNVIPNFYRFS